MGIGLYTRSYKLQHYVPSMTISRLGKLKIAFWTVKALAIALIFAVSFIDTALSLLLVIAYLAGWVFADITIKR